MSQRLGTLVGKVLESTNRKLMQDQHICSMLKYYAT